jgi:hypothetical protein
MGSVLALKYVVDDDMLEFRTSLRKSCCDCCGRNGGSGDCTTVIPAIANVLNS